MNAQAKNAAKYMTSLKSLTTQMWAKDGTRLFDMEGGTVEGERIATLLDEAKTLHPRSSCWKSAMTVWASLIREASAENLDWAVLQGCTYAGWELPNVPETTEDVNLDELADEDL